MSFRKLTHFSTDNSTVTLFTIKRVVIDLGNLQVYEAPPECVMSKENCLGIQVGRGWGMGGIENC